MYFNKSNVHVWWPCQVGPGLETPDCPGQVDDAIGQLIILWTCPTGQVDIYTWKWFKIKEYCINLSSFIDTTPFCGSEREHHYFTQVGDLQYEINIAGPIYMLQCMAPAHCVTAHLDPNWPRISGMQMNNNGEIWLAISFLGHWVPRKHTQTHGFTTTDFTTDFTTIVLQYQ
jgi:hypothetical protein